MESSALAPGTDDVAARGYSEARVELGWKALPGWRGEALVLGFFVLATLVLAWPLPATLSQASGMRGDYYNNLWNAWWLEHSLASGSSPFETDFLYFPDGISLRRHTLSLLNSGALVALKRLVDPHAAFSLLILAHFALSAWTFSLLARHVSQSLLGGIFAGLVYSFSPFHYFYLCQLNVFSFEFLPLGLLFALLFARSGRRAHLAGVVLALVGMVLTVEYYVVYCYLAVAVLFVAKREWGREVAWGTALRRLTFAALLGGTLVVLCAWPLLSASIGAEGRAVVTSANAIEKSRFNDLYGFFWIGGDEECTVSWPTMLGYSTLALVACGLRATLRRWSWWLLALVFLVLSLGAELSIGRVSTGIPLPYAILDDLPVLSLLRKSDRAFLVVEIAVCVLAAVAFGALARRLRTPLARGALFVLCAGLAMVELTGVPFARFTLERPEQFAALRADPSTAVLELPPMPLHVMNGRYDYYQTLHGKKTTLGYTTSLALQPVHDERLMRLANLYLEYISQRNRELPRFARELGVQRAVHYKTFLDNRPRDTRIDGKTLWQPFFFLRGPLVYVRQVGEYVPVAYPKESWNLIRLLLQRSLGPPLHEDETYAIFDVPRGP